MKTVGILLVMLCLLVPWAVQAQAEENDPYLITEDSIGPLQLGMAETEAVTIAKQVFGEGHERSIKRSQGTVVMWTTDKPGVWFEFCRPLPSVPAYPGCNGRVIFLHLWRAVNRPELNQKVALYHTKEGIALGDSVSKVVTAYGQPPYRKPGDPRLPLQGGEVLAWTHPRLAIAASQGVIDTIGVFDPTFTWPWTATAKQ